MAKIMAIANTQITEQPIIPKVAYIFYQQGEKTVCATRHTVNKNQSLSLGTMVNPTKIQLSFSQLEVTNSQEDGEAEQALLPGNVLLNNNTHLMWFKPRQIKPMWFRLGGNASGLTVEWPPLLYIANKENIGLRVFALGSNKRPDSRTRVYHAPLMNIDDEGRFCEGSATLPRTCTLSSVDGFEASLCDSQFTHINHDNTLRGGANDAELYRYWQNKTSAAQPLRVKACELKMLRRLDSLLTQQN